jgi:NADH dehydrogenase
LLVSARGRAAIVNLVGIIASTARAASRSTAARPRDREQLAVAAAGVKRYTDERLVRPDVCSGKCSKWQGEAVRASGTTGRSRPSIVFGRGDEFMSVLATMIRRYPVVPVLGDGNYRLQPIAVEQVAEGFVQALRTVLSVGQTYDVAGPQPYRLVEIEIGAAGPRTVRKVHVPLGAVKLATRAPAGSLLPRIRTSS